MLIKAPAKINLALHVTGQRADGYHVLDSLVVFTGFGDDLTFTLAEIDTLIIDGPFAASLHNSKSNLVMQAMTRLRAFASAHPCPPVDIRLTKNLPVASGIGGGSSDAAATLRGLCQLWNLPYSLSELQALGASLGADVPMCLAGKPLRATGIGDEIVLFSAFPALDLVVVNPGVEISTPEIFKALTKKDNRPMSSKSNLTSFHAVSEFLSAQHNDLQRPAIALQPVIADCLSVLQDKGAMLVRMSGSGATCFGLFTNPAMAARAAQSIRAAHPNWFAVATKTGAA